jgi:hypothetical protein
MTPALKETFHDIEGWACDVDVAMGAPRIAQNE